MTIKQWPAPRRIVVRGVNWLGDAVMTMPALHRLKEAYPDAHLTVLTLPKLAELYDCQPDVDAVMPLVPDESLLALSARLRRGRFDTALILTHSPRSVFPFVLAGVPRRVGYGERGRAWLLTQAVEAPFNIKIQARSEAEIKSLVAAADAPSDRTSASFAQGKTSQPPASSAARPSVHFLHHYLYLAGAMGASTQPCAPALRVPASTAEAARSRFGLPPSGSEIPLIGLIPGAEYGLAKRWPPERYIAAGVALRKRLRCGFVIVGGKTDFELGERVAQGVRQQAGTETAGAERPDDAQWVWNLAGQTDTRELCAVLHLCAGAIGNDTGPMHVAAAVGTPVVVPFGSTSPLLSEPGLPGSGRHRPLQGVAACAPCFQRVCPIDFRCMNSIGVERVVEAVLSLPLCVK